MSVLRLYEPEECGEDGYPIAWHKPTEMVLWAGPKVANSYETELVPPIKDLVRERAGHRCVRCGHPYRKGLGDRGWSPCDSHCTHKLDTDGIFDDVPWSRWRILTVHHLNGVKADCRWWNLVALCQRCHLSIQGRVVMERAFILEHSEWFKPYAAGWYAAKYLEEEWTREDVLEHMNGLLDLERLT